MTAPEVAAPAPAPSGVFSELYRLIAEAIPHIEDRKRAATLLERATQKLEDMVAERTYTLRESEARFRSLTELSSEWYWEQDEQFRFTFFSEARGVARTDIGSAQLGKRRWELAVEGESQAQWAAHKALLERHDRFFDFEFRRRLPDGTVAWRHVSGAPTFDAAGRFRGYHGVGQDITERKRAEEALRLSEQRFRLAASRGQVWDWNIVANTVTFPFEFWRRLGYDERDVGDPVAMFESILHPEDLGPWRQVLKDHVSRHLPYELEFRARTKSGEYHWFDTAGQAVWDETGQATYMAGTTFDVTERKEAETALRESEARFRSLTELSSDWYWEQDEQFRFTFFSEARGVARAAVGPVQLGKRRWELAVVGVSEAQWAAHKAVLERHEPFFDFEYRRRLPDGTLAWRRISGAPTFDAAGRFKGYHGIGHDITEQRLAEQALREQTERLQLGQAAARLIVLDWSIAEDRITWTDSPEWLRGPLPASGKYPSFKDQVHPEDREAFLAIRAQAMASLDGRTNEFRFVCTDGKVLWLLSCQKVFADATGKAARMLIALSDITDRKRAEQALQASEERFRLFMENSPALAWIKDSRLRMVWINRKFERTRGKILGEIIGRDDFDLLPGESARRIRMQDEEVLRLNGPAQYVNVIPNPDGTESAYLVVRFPLPEASGESGVAGIAIDVTDSRRLEQTVRQLLKRLVDTQEAERRKVAEDLHDLIGQKLTALGINLDIVRQALPETVSASLAPRLRQMSALIEETIGAIREVMSELRPAMLDDHGLTASVFQYASVFEARTGLRVQVTGPEWHIPLPHDVAIALYRITQEALTNAAKHSGASRVQVTIAKDPQRVELRIADDGRGMREPDAAATGPISGWGLPEMRERAEAVGGRLRVEAASPGTRIVVEVPLGNADQRHPG